MTKTPEEIIAEFEERYYTSEHPHQMMCREHAAPATISEVKSFITESLAAYRLSVLSECEGLVEDEEKKGYMNILFGGGMVHKHPIASDYDAGFNAANALWRERIAALKEK